MVVAAVVAIAWLGVWLQSTRLSADARRTGALARTPAQVDRSVTLFRDAARLTPDTQPEVGEAFVLIRARQAQRGARILRGVLRREPRNVTAWAYLAIALEVSGDQAGAAAAKAKVLKLNPPVKP